MKHDPNQKPTNRIELRSRRLDLNGADNHESFQFYYDMRGFIGIGLEAWVDGKRLAPIGAIDLPTPLFSAHEPLNGNSYYEALFTCGCGIAGCASMCDNVTVTHEPNFILWSCPYPINFDTKTDRSKQDEVLNFRFHRQEMVSQQRRLVDTIRRIAHGHESRYRIPIYEEFVSELIAKGIIFSAGNK